jgi:hypothetical protein
MRDRARKAKRGIVAGVAILIGCVAFPPSLYQAGSPGREMTIDAVLKKHSEELMSLPGVVGAAQGICEGRDCIKVFVRKRTSELEQRIPPVLDGYPVEIEESGEFRPLPD